MIVCAYLASALAIAAPDESEAPEPAATEPQPDEGRTFPVPGDRFDVLDCRAEHTAGFHDHPGDQESYQASLFYPNRFLLTTNAALEFAMAGDPEAADAYLALTLLPSESGEVPVEPDIPVELECRNVRGGGSRGLSCINLPPSEMLLINRETLRFTRTSVGGWTFQGATENLGGDSIFVEYGQCVRSGRSG